MSYSKIERLQTIKELYDNHYRAICYFAFKLIQDKDVAEDITMDTFLSLLNQTKKLEQEVASKALLYKIAHNKCIDYIRKQHTKNNYVRNIQITQISELPSYVNEMIMARVLQAIYEEIEQLPEQRKNIFKAIFFQGKRTVTIANEFNISQQTVLNQKSAAIHTIKQKMSKELIKELLVS
ncbi:MAG: sigma-70 family RNA polymerase sigma factor [Ginsengibacter sp.]